MGILSVFSRYIVRQFLQIFLAVLIALTVFVGIIEFVEMSRRLADEDGATTGMALQISLLKLSETIELIFPFAVLFAGMFTFWRMTRSRELVIARAAGVSAWQFIAPVLIVGVAIGVFKVAIYDPVGAALEQRYEEMETRFFGGNRQAERMQVLSQGLWLRQDTPDGLNLMVARGMGQDASVLRDIIIFRYTPDGDFRDRVDAARARLADGAWTVEQARIAAPGDQPRAVDRLTIETSLDAESIEDSFTQPGSLSFWQLPNFIATLEESGFSAVRHRLHFQRLLSQPLLMVAMVLFAAAFTLRLNQRRGSGLGMSIAGIATALGIFVLSDVVGALGLAQSIPIVLAAWAPAGIGVLVAVALLLHLEDG